MIYRNKDKIMTQSTHEVGQIWFQFWGNNEQGSFICIADREMLKYDEQGEYIDDPIFLPDLTEWLPEGSHEEFSHCYFIPFDEATTREKLLALGYLETNQLMPKMD
jgi:hypothetical protein